jgi:hypothetical protein
MIFWDAGERLTVARKKRPLDYRKRCYKGLQVAIRNFGKAQVRAYPIRRVE